MKISKRNFEKTLTKKYKQIYVDTIQDIDYSGGPEDSKLITLNLYYSDEELMKHIGTWQSGNGIEF